MAESSKTVVVDGATGYIGNHLVAALMEKGYEVRCLVHSGAKQSDIDFLKSLKARVFISDLDNDSGELAKAFAGAATAVHLIGSIAPPKGQSLKDLHVNQTKQLLESLKVHNVKKIVMVTALGSSLEASSQYHKTKWQAEEAIRASGMNYVILRPSLIFGRQVGSRDSKLVARLIEAIKTRPVVPLINGGKNLIQPIFIGDLTKALIVAIENEQLTNKTVELGGATVISMKDFVGSLMDTLEIRKPIVGLPPAIATLLASYMEMTSTVPLISRDQVLIASNNNVCTINDLNEKLNIDPCQLKTGLETYKEKSLKTMEMSR